MNKNGHSSFHIGFEFNVPANLIRVELDLFNCPEWGIAAQSITVYKYFDITNFDVDLAGALSPALGHTMAGTTSCTSIVRVDIPLEVSQNPTAFYFIVFTFGNVAASNIKWVHIAEVRFFEEEGSQCPTSTGRIIPYIWKFSCSKIFVFYYFVS